VQTSSKWAKESIVLTEKPEEIGIKHGDWDGALIESMEDFIEKTIRKMDGRRILRDDAVS
jgi:hypothetical protein